MSMRNFIAAVPMIGFLSIPVSIASTAAFMHDKPSDPPVKRSAEEWSKRTVIRSDDAAPFWNEMKIVKWCAAQKNYIVRYGDNMWRGTGEDGYTMLDKDADLSTFCTQS